MGEVCLERLYSEVKKRQVCCAEAIRESRNLDFKNHQIGMFSAYSEVLNLLDVELSLLGVGDAKNRL